jgi:DNA damage-inducible protein 1
VQTQVPLVQQQLLFNGKEVQNTMRLNAAGVGEDDLLMLVSAPTPSSAGGPAPSDLAFNPDGSAVNPIALQRHLRGDPNVMSQLQQNNPELAQAILSDDTEVLQMLLRRQHQHRVELQRRQQQELDLMNADPFDVDAQRKIEEAIRQKNVDENWEAAIEYNPEAFARVVRLNTILGL